MLLWAKWNASRSDALLSNLIALAVPFTTYFLAEELHGSGVLTVVACGIVYSRYNGNANDSAIRLVGIPFWSVLTYLMKTVLLIMVGLSLPDIVRRLPHQEGAISLAMALSIPGSFGGTAYEERDLVVLITAGVTLLSLVVQGIALPHVVRWANARPTAVQRREAEELDEETRVLAGIMRDIVEELPSMAQRIGVEDGELVNAIRESYGRREQLMLQAASEEEFSFFDEDETALRLECIDFARARVLEARNAGRLDGATASLAINASTPRAHCWRDRSRWSEAAGASRASVQAPGSSGPTTALAAFEHTLRSAWLRVTCAVSPGRTTVTRSALAVEHPAAAGSSSVRIACADSWGSTLKMFPGSSPSRIASKPTVSFVCDDMKDTCGKPLIVHSWLLPFQKEIVTVVVPPFVVFSPRDAWSSSAVHGSPSTSGGGRDGEAVAAPDWGAPVAGGWAVPEAPPVALCEPVPLWAVPPGAQAPSATQARAAVIIRSFFTMCPS